MSVTIVLLALVAAASLGATKAQLCPTDQLCPDDHFCALSSQGECDCRKTHGSDKFCVKDKLFRGNPGCVVDNQCHTGVTGSSCEEKERAGTKFLCFQEDENTSGCVEEPK